MTIYSTFVSIFTPFFAFSLDTLIGDPHSKYHPVALIGNVISFYEKIFYYKRDRRSKKLLYGAVTAIASLLTVTLVGATILFIGGMIHYWIEIVLQIIILYICISPRALATAGLEIAGCLRHRDLGRARQKLSWIVGRDTDDLDESEITRGAVETMAENMVDGIIGPLLAFAFFGPLGALFYRTVNTLDSMLGYKNERFLYFGRFAARFDDLVNLIPARITFLLVVVSALFLGKDYKRAWRLGLRDARKHPSPNGGYAEAPVAGALHIRLGGYNSYEGVVSFRAYMGDPISPLRALHINQCATLLYGTTFLGVILSTVIHYFIYN